MMEARAQRDVSRRSRLMYIIEAALEYFISLMVTGAYLARITASLGFSDSLTGILSSFVSLGCLFRLGAISLFRNTRRVKRPIIFCHMANETLFALTYLTPVLPLEGWMKTALFLVCFCGAYIITNVITAPKIGWEMSHVPDHARGSFTANKEIVSLLSGIAFTTATGVAFDALDATGDTRLAFVVGAVAIFGLMLLHVLSLVGIHENEAPAAQSENRGSVRELMHDKRFLRVMLACALWYMAYYGSTPFFGSYQIKELGFSMTFISVITIAHSVVRAVCSPFVGRYADKHSFSRMVELCFIIAAASFLVNIFTVPENGAVFFTLYYCLHGAAWSGINSAVMNLIYDYVDERNRSSALAINMAVGGVAGFLATCVMSAVVDVIQRQGNTLMGVAMYPAQFVSAFAFVLTLVVIAYTYFALIRREPRR